MTKSKVGVDGRGNMAKNGVQFLFFPSPQRKVSWHRVEFALPKNGVWLDSKA